MGGFAGLQLFHDMRRRIVETLHGIRPMSRDTLVSLAILLALILAVIL